MNDIKHRIKLTDEQVTDYAMGRSVDEIVSEVACNSRYHPAGYGLWSARIVEENGEHFATWTSSSSCD